MVCYILVQVAMLGEDLVEDGEKFGVIGEGLRRRWNRGRRANCKALRGRTGLEKSEDV